MKRKEKVGNVILILLGAVIFVSAISFGIYYLLNNEVNSSNSIFQDAKVIEVIDGDTFVIENGEHVRMICIDAPELKSKGGEEAKSYLSSLILNKTVRLEKDFSEYDDYGRLLRYVYVQDGNVSLFVNRDLVRVGYASVFVYGSDVKRCGEIEGK